MQLSVIIPAYNHLAEVHQCLNSLQAFQRGAVQYIVSDDASPDVWFPAMINPRVAHVVRRESNGGFAENCNTGARFALGDVLLFVNQDVYAHEQWSLAWDEALLRAFEDPDVGVVGARLLFPDGSVQNAGGLYDARKQPFHRCLGYRDPLYAEINTPGVVSWTTGAALAIRRELFEQVGGFDTRYTRGYFEDVDLCEKAKAAGYRVWYEPGCTFIHLAGTSGGNPHFRENAQIFYAQWVNSGIIQPDVYAVKVNFW